MIKNEAQLTRTLAKLGELRILVDDLRRDYDSKDWELKVAPLLEQVRLLQTEVDEYQLLSNMTLEQAVKGPLDKGVLIENIGELLSRLRIAAGLTQAELADRLGWDQPNVSRFESATYSGQSIAKISEYLDALGVWLHVRPATSEVPIVIRYKKTEQAQTVTLDDSA